MKESEGRKTAGLDEADKIDQARRTYEASEKGKAAKRRYAQSERGREAHKRYTNSYKFKLVLQKYHQSEKGQKRRQVLLDNKKELRKAMRWLRDNPGKTIQDYLHTASNASGIKSAEPGEKEKADVR